MITIQSIRRWDSTETIDLVLDVSGGPRHVDGGAGAAHPGERTATTVVDGTGYVLAPGLADPHVHFRDPGQTRKESMLSGSRAAAAGGYTRVLIMPNTQPPLDGRTPRPDEPGADEIRDSHCHDAIEYLQRYESLHDLRLPVHYDLAVCASIGRAGHEASRPEDWSRYMVPNVAADRHPVTFMSDDGAAVTDGILDQVLANASVAGLTLLEHCEHHDHGVMNEGAVSRRLGYPGVPESTERSIVWRDIQACRRTGVPIHFQHVSTASSFDLIRRAKADGLPITCETAPHYLALCDEDVERYGALAKMNPPLRSEHDRLATLAAIADGTVDMLATDHAPHTEAEKRADFLEAPNGVIGLETAYGVCHHALVDGGYIDDLRLIELMATAPTRFLGYEPTDVEPLLQTRPDCERRVLDLHALLERPRRLGRGIDPAAVNLTILAPQEHWTVDPNHFQSKARNTPFAGWQVTGRPVATILDAQLVFNGIAQHSTQGA